MWNYCKTIFLLCFLPAINSKYSIFSDPLLLSRTFKTDNSTVYEYRTEYLEVPLDHFSFAVNHRFKLRYLINDTWHQGNDAPIFFYTGNEGFIEVFAQNTGFMWDIATDFDALLVFAEHRYYGKSRPFENETYYSDPKYMGYLNSEQALADFVELISYLKTKPNMKNSPVIVFGGSYGGMLSAWLRIKYPHVVQGAIASSAPILHFTGHTDCAEFAKIVTSDFRRANPTCPNLIKQSWATLTNVTSTDEGLKWLSENWNFCTPLANANTVYFVKRWLELIYDYLAMVDYPYETNFLTPLPANPVAEACKHLDNATLTDKELLLSVFKAISVFTNYTGETKCNSLNDAAPQLGATYWNYQACTEIIMPLCTNGITDMFEPSTWNEEMFSKACFNAYKVRPQFNRACKVYGCSDLSAASNIVFSNGLLDPWSGGGVKENASSTAVAYIIPDAAHHLELRSENRKDSLNVREARNFQRASIAQWIKQYRDMISNKPSPF